MFFQNWNLIESSLGYVKGASIFKTNLLLSSVITVEIILKIYTIVRRK